MTVPMSSPSQLPPPPASANKGGAMDLDKTPKTKGRRSVSKIKNKLPIVSISIPKKLNIDVPSPSSFSHQEQNAPDEVSPKNHHHGDNISPGNHSRGTSTAATSPTTVPESEEEFLLRKVEDTLQKHVVGSGSSVFSEQDIQRDSFIARLASLARKARSSNASIQSASVGASTLERYYMSEDDDTLEVASRIGIQPHDATHKDLIEALERMNEFLKVTEIELGEEKKKRKTREKNMIKLAKELGTRGKIMQQQIDKINDLQHDLRISQTEVELMTKQLTHAENNKERVLDEARQERERLLEEARQRYERTCREHDQRLHELAKSHDDNCERLCREIVDLTKDNKQLKLALHMVKEEARNRPPPPPPGPTPAQIRKYVFLGAFMVCCGLLLGKLAVDTVIRPQRNVPLPSGYNDNSDLQQRPSSSSRKNLLFAKRRSPLPFSRTKMMQPSRIYEQVLSQEEHNIVEVEQEVKPVAFEDIVNEQQQEQQEVQEPVIPQTKAPLEPVVQETVATAKQQAVVETTPSNVSNDSNSNYHHNHRLVQPEKIHAYVQHWLNVLRQAMIAAEPRMHSIKDFAVRAALKIQSIEWSHGMSQSEWVEIRYKLL